MRYGTDCYGCGMMVLTPMEGMSGMLKVGGIAAGAGGTLFTLFYLSKMKNRVVDDLAEVVLARSEQVRGTREHVSAARSRQTSPRPGRTLGRINGARDVQGGAPLDVRQDAIVDGTALLEILRVG